MTKRIERTPPDFPDCYGKFLKDDESCKECPCETDCMMAKYGHSAEDD